MRISTHNGLEVWLEWRPASSPSTKEGGEVQEWTKLNERPPRVISGEVLITKGAVEIDVDTLAGHSAIEYRLALKQANYHDWAQDLRVEIKSNDKVLGVVYLLPGQDHPTYCTLTGWSPISQDELAAALASKPGMSDMIPSELPELDGGVDEEALKALLEADIGTEEVHGPPVVQSDEVSDTILDEGINTSPTQASIHHASNVLPSQPLEGSSLEITVFRGQHTALPPTPPPDYVEGDIGNGLYNGLSRLSFGGKDDSRDEWNAEDAEGVAWCQFIYEVSTDSPPLATSEPYILGNDDSARLSAELAQYASNIELEAERKLEEDRRAEQQKLQDEERERQEAAERAQEDAFIMESLAVIEKEKRSEAGKKGWQTQLKNGRVTASMLKAAAKAEARVATKKNQDEGRPVPKNESGVLHFRSSTDSIRLNRLRQLGYERYGARSENSKAGPSRSTKSVRSDRHPRKDDVELPPPKSLRPITKPLKRTSSSISEGDQIILPARDKYDTPPSRLVLTPQLHRSSDGRPRRDNRRPEVFKHVKRDTDPPTRTKTGLRRTDIPADYGLPVARYPRRRDYDPEQHAGSGHRRNFRRITRPEDVGLPRSSVDADNREREERQAQDRRMARREREDREKREAQKRREERDVRERREAREKLERKEAERRAEEEEERKLGPMEEQLRAFEEREYQRRVKRAQVERKEERGRKRRLEGSERRPIVVPDREAKRENGDRPVGRGSRLSVRGAVIDMTELSD